MHQLAFLSYVNSSGKTDAVCAADVLHIVHRQDGSNFILRDGTTVETQTTVAAAVTAIDALWTEYLTALGDPA